jgi:RNA-directed DNA polymerase
VRGADDFLITGRTPAVLAQEVKPLGEGFVKERGLTLSVEQTRLTHIAQGMDLLGPHIRKDRGQFLVIPSQKNRRALLEKIRALIRSHQPATAGSLIVQLNPRIRGGATSHRHCASTRTFSKIDDAISQALWRWARRRHPHKSRRGIAHNYFTPRGRRPWVFHGTTVGPKGEGKGHALRKAADMPLRRHTTLQAAAHPDDPQGEVYCEQRLGVAMEAHLQGRRRLRHLWKEPKGICPVCQQRITTWTGWHNPHIVWRALGGSDLAANRV